jgi:hypothetical protein
MKPEIIDVCNKFMQGVCMSPSRAQFFIFPDPAAQLVFFSVGAE